MQIAARTAGGLIKISVGTFGASYSAPPDVTISGGGGTGAQGVAHIDGGRVQSVVITNAGTGYTSNPTVTITARAQAVTVQSVTAGTDSVTVTLASEVSSTSWPSILSGGTTSSVVQFSNATQLVVSGTAATTGSATLYHNGSGATARAFAYTGSIRPLTFYAGRYNDVYGVDGMGRGIRYILYPKPDYGECDLETVGGDTLVSEAGDTLITEYGAEVNARPIGLNKPAIGPAVTAGATGTGKFVGSIQMVRGGAGYASVPTVTLTNGSPTKPAKARAVVIQGRVDRIILTDVGEGYQETPTVTLSGGVGQGATFTPSLIGSLASVDVVAGGTGYTSSATTGPTVVFHNTNGLTQAAVRLGVNERGAIDSALVLSSGTGCTAEGVTATVVGGGGTGASLGVRMRYQITALTVAHSGSGYFTPPVITIQRDALDTEASEASATAAVDGHGHISSATVVAGGQYSNAPTAFVANSEARAQATLRERLRGTFYCCIRYFDDTPENQNGPVYSSISELVEVACDEGAGGITWSFSHYGLDPRVIGMELWRSSSDQRTVLFRVARILRSDVQWSGSYLDTVSDAELTSTQRADYGLMPITLPSGQINARRFEVPPGEFAVACMFQDRAWYAKDILGLKPNSLLFSEIDEAESVPAENEIVVQENSVTADTIQALIPLGPSLLIVQTSHIYKLMYVAQPIIDASITLASYRGILHERCWAVMGGVAFIVDSNGMYAFDGQSEEAISAAVDDYWRDAIIDFSKVEQFHVSADFLTKVVRFHYCQASDTEPVRALCYCVATKAWWEETRAVAHTASTLAVIGRRWLQVAATGGGGLVRHGGLADGGAPVQYMYRSGPLALDAGPSRSVAVVYKPTPSANPLQVSLHYNNSTAPRPNAISTDTGSGFVATQGGTAAVLDMAQSRSPLGAANGFARATVVGRRDDRSVGGDRHIALAMAGTQATTNAGDGVVVYSTQIEGTG